MAQLYPYWLGQNPQPLPYGSFSSSQTQIVTGANITTSISYTNVEAASQTDISGSQIYVRAIGVYRLVYSIQLDTTTGGSQPVFIWIQKNGVNVPRSATEFRITNQEQICAVTEIILPLLTGDYVEVVFQSSDANMRALAISAGGVAPNNYPAIPSIITNIQKIA